VISRVWHGWTRRGADADTYERMLRATILPGIGRVKGYRGADLLRRDDGDEVEFVTVTLFDSLDAVRAFAGADYTKAVIHEDARRLLTRYDERSVHYETVVRLGS
jgi:heme-degrading monooxygenase HmoA